MGIIALLLVALMGIATVGCTDNPAVASHTQTAEHDRLVQIAENSKRTTEAEARCNGLKGKKRQAEPICLWQDCPGVAWPHYEAAAKKEITVGMNGCLVLAAWGDPEDINRTTNAAGTRYQLVYSNHRYVYVDGDTVTSISE